jgi:hypothetical protein
VLSGLVFGLVLGADAIYVGIEAIHKGELARSLPGYLAMPGEWVIAMGIFILSVTFWGFWRWSRGVE